MEVTETPKAIARREAGWHTVREVAALHGVSRQTIYNRLKAADGIRTKTISFDDAYDRISGGFSLGSGEVVCIWYEDLGKLI